MSGRRLGSRATVVLLALGCLAGPLLGGCTTPVGDHTLLKPLAVERSATVPLSDGDLLQVSIRDLHDVVTQHYSAQAKRWTQPRTLVDVTDRECGDVDASSATGTVAVLLECDVSYVEDSAPVESLALVSDDLLHWDRHELSGEAYGQPAVSANGRYSVWPQDDGVLRWDGTEFADHALNFAAIVAVTDDGDPIGAEESECGVAISGPVEADVPLSPSCPLPQLYDFRFEDPDTIRANQEGVHGGDLVIRREGDNWVLTEPPPILQPGLIDYEGSVGRAIFTRTLQDADGNVIAFGSPDRQHLMVQRYDAQAQRWLGAVLLHDQGFPGCTADAYDFGLEPSRHLRIEFLCYPIEQDSYPPRAPDEPGEGLPRDGQIAWVSIDAGLTWAQE